MKRWEPALDRVVGPAVAGRRVAPKRGGLWLVPPILVRATIAVAWMTGGSVPVRAVEGGTPAARSEGSQAAPTPSPSGDSKSATCDTACVRGGAERAAQVCAPRIENEAPFDFEWLTRPYGSIFQEADPPAAGGVVVRYKGDSIRFMSPQREWVRITYECAFNSTTQRVEGVNVRLGRLNGRGQPPPVAGNGGRVAATPPQQQAGPPVPAAPTPPRKPKPGEPSSIEILQVNPFGR